MIRFYFSVVVCAVLGITGGIFANSPGTVSPSSQCINSRCACVDCQCEPCECPCDTVEGLAAVADTRPIIYFFTGDYCIPCREMKPVVDEIASEGHRLVSMSDGEPRYAEYFAYYGINSVPQFVVVDSKGHELSRFLGKTSKESLVRAVSFGDEGSVVRTLPATSSRQVYLQKPGRSGWFQSSRAGATSTCGPCGCR